MIKENAFVEHAMFGGNRYGTSKRTIGELTASGRVVVLDIEMEVCPPFPLSYFSLGQTSNQSLRYRGEVCIGNLGLICGYNRA